MKYLMKSGTQPTVGFTAERNATPLPGLMRQPSTLYEDSDLTLEPSTSRAGGMGRARALRLTPPLASWEQQGAYTVGSFIGSWTVAAIMDIVRLKGLRINGNVAAIIRENLELNGACSWLFSNE